MSINFIQVHSIKQYQSFFRIKDFYKHFYKIYTFFIEVKNLNIIVPQKASDLNLKH